MPLYILALITIKGHNMSYYPAWSPEIIAQAAADWLQYIEQTDYPLPIKFVLWHNEHRPEIKPAMSRDMADLPDLVMIKKKAMIKCEQYLADGMTSGKIPVVAAIFLLKAQLGYRDTPQPEQPQKVEINLTIDTPEQAQAAFSAIRRADATKRKG